MKADCKQQPSQSDVAPLYPNNFITVFVPNYLITIAKPNFLAFSSAVDITKDSMG